MITFTVKQAREYASITQADMAKMLGCSRDKYIKLEAEPNKFTIEMAKKFSEIVNLPYECIIYT